MSAIVITFLRFGFLILLWLFVFFVLVTVKNDIYGTHVVSRSSPHKAKRASTTPTVEKSSVTRPPAQPQLVISAGSLAGTALPLGSGSITVGRSPDSALVLDDGYTSARHARFFNDGGDWYVEDLNSTNGTWVGNERIYQPTRLPFGTPITIGKTVLELRR